MAKWAFDDNIPKARPRLRLGKALGEIDTVTEPPPVRSRAEPAVDRVESDEANELAEAPRPTSLPEPRASSVETAAQADDADQLQAESEASALAAPHNLTPESESPDRGHAAVPAVGEATFLPPEAVEEAEEAAPLDPAPSEPISVTSAPSATLPLFDDGENVTRRASLKRRAAGLGALPEPPAPPPTSVLDELDALASTAELATELERALDAAAESNEQLRGDLNSALDDLARSTAESKRLHERVERLESETRDRARVVQDLVRELELLEGERDGALTQAADAQIEIETLGEKHLLIERRVHDLERGLTDAQARNKRFDEAAQAHAAQRTALRAELEALRRERDGLLVRNAEIEREREELGRSRKALDEVHRALSEARQRAQRIRPR